MLLDSLSRNIGKKFKAKPCSLKHKTSKKDFIKTEVKKAKKK